MTARLPFESRDSPTLATLSPRERDEYDRMMGCDYCNGNGFFWGIDGRKYQCRHTLAQVSASAIKQAAE